MLLTLVLLAGSAMASVSHAGDGVIEGVVVRAADRTPVPGAEVVLRAKVRDQLVPVAETIADAKGTFHFEHLPTDRVSLYLPGANRDGIHYPGPSVALTSLQRRRAVQLVVHDAITFPNPLVVRRHTITLCPQPGALRVTESMLIDNPSAACYVGQAAGQSAQPVTLQLAIPTDFRQVIFASEFFGRRFAIIDGKLVTGVPWPPGQRELTFSYVLANTRRHYVWQRPLDLPSAKVHVSVHDNRPGQGTFDGNQTSRKNDDEVAFDSGEHALSAGHLLRVELGHMPVSLMTYAPYAALLTLAATLLATCWPVIRRQARH